MFQRFNLSTLEVLNRRKILPPNYFLVDRKLIFCISNDDIGK